jgi:hypothetical protein
MDGQIVSSSDSDHRTAGSETTILRAGGARQSGHFGAFCGRIAGWRRRPSATAEHLFLIPLLIMLPEARDMEACCGLFGMPRRKFCGEIRQLAMIVREFAGVPPSRRRFPTAAEPREGAASPWALTGHVLLFRLYLFRKRDGNAAKAMSLVDFLSAEGGD